MDEIDHKALEERARHLYRQAAEQLDPATRARLAAARERALGARAPLTGRAWLLPAAAVTGAAAIGLAVLLSSREPADFGQMASEDPAAEDVELWSFCSLRTIWTCCQSSTSTSGWIRNRMTDETG